MRRLVELSLASCMFAFLISGNAANGMYTDLSRGGILEEILAYMDDHAVLIEPEDHTKFDSIESVKKEKERREENWRELAAQEWECGLLTLGGSLETLTSPGPSFLPRP